MGVFRMLYFRVLGAWRYLSCLEYLGRGSRPLSLPKPKNINHPALQNLPGNKTENMKKIHVLIGLLAVSLIACNSTPSRTKPIDEYVLEILHNLPEMSPEEFQAYYATTDELHQILKDENGPLDDQFKEIYRANRDGLALKKVCNQHYQELVDSDSGYSFQINWKSLKNKTYTNQLYHGGVSRMFQSMSDGEREYEVQIQFIPYKGEVFLLHLFPLECISNCQ